MNGLNLNEADLLTQYRKAKDIEIERLLTQYGTSLANVREMYPQLTETIKARQLTTTFPTQPLFFTASEVAQMGLSLQEGWMLKMTPIEGNGDFTSSLITPQKWEITENDLYISPTGEKYNKADLEALLALPSGLDEGITGIPTLENLTAEGKSLYQEYQGAGGELDVSGWLDLREHQQLETEQVFGAVFPEQDINEVIAYMQKQPEAFLADLREIGRTPETEALLKTLAPEITQEEMFEIFGRLPEVEESGWKNVLDALQLGARTFWYQTKQAFTSLIPQFFAQFFKEEPGTSAWAIEGQTPQVPMTTINPVTGETEVFGEGEILAEEVVPDWFRQVTESYQPQVQQTLETLQTKYGEHKAEMREWLIAHPELQPPKEWEGNLIDKVKEDPSILLNPAYIAYVAAESATYSTAFMGTSLIVGAATGNPYIGMAAGLVLTTPAQITDLYEDLLASGASHDQALQLAVPIGAIINSVECWGDMPFLKAVSPVFARAFSQSIKTELVNLTWRQLIRKGLKTFTDIEIAETLEEIVQQAMQNATIATIDQNRDILGNVPEITVRTLIATLPFSIFGGGTHTAHLYSYLNSSQKQQITETIGKLTQNGVSREQAELVAIGQVLDTEEGQKALSKAVEEVSALPEIQRQAQTAINQIKENNPDLVLGDLGIKDPSKITNPLAATPEDVLTIPANEEIQKGLLIPNWVRSVLKKTEAIPGIGKVQRAILGWRSTLDLENDTTEAVVGRSAVVYGAITRMGVNTAKVIVGTLRNILTNPVRYFGFNNVGYSAKMAGKALSEYKGEGNIGTLEDVFTHPERYDWTGMDKGLEYVSRFNRVQKRIFALLQKEGVALNLVNEAWMHRVVTGRTVEGEVIETRGRLGRTAKAVGATPSYEKPRTFKTMAEGIQASVQYEPNAEVSIGSYIEEVYKKIAGERVEADLQTFGETPSERLLERFPEIAETAERTKEELADAAKLHEVVLRAKRGEKLPEQTLRAMERKFPELGHRLRALVEQGSDVNRELRAILKQNERYIKQLRAQLAEAKKAKPPLVQAKTEGAKAAVTDIEAHVEGKYSKLPGDESEAIAKHAPVELIDDRELTPDAIDKALENLTPEDAKSEIEAIEGTIGDQTGDLIETYRYESWGEGEEFENYLDSLLAVTQKYKKALGLPITVDLSIGPLTGEARKVIPPPGPIIVPDEVKLTEAFRLMDYEDRLAFRNTMDSQLQDLGTMLEEQRAQLDGLVETFEQDPARPFIDVVAKTGEYKGEIAYLTVNQYRILTGAKWKIQTMEKMGKTIKKKVLIGGHMPTQGMMTPDGTKVRWEYALDTIATEKGYKSDEDFKKAIEAALDMKQSIDDLKVMIRAGKARVDGVNKMLKILTGVEGNLKGIKPAEPVEVEPGEVTIPGIEGKAMATPQKTVEYMDPHGKKVKMASEDAINLQRDLQYYIELTRRRLERLKATKVRNPDWEAYDPRIDEVVGIDIRIEEQEVVLGEYKDELARLGEALEKAGIGLELATEWLEAAQKLEAAGEKIGGMREQALELARRFYAPYILRGDTLESIMDSWMGFSSKEMGEVKTGGYIEGKKIKRGEVSVRLPGGSIFIFKLADIAKSIRETSPEAKLEPGPISAEVWNSMEAPERVAWVQQAGLEGKVGSKSYENLTDNEVKALERAREVREEQALYMTVPVMSFAQFKQILDRVTKETKNLYDLVRERWREWVKIRTGVLSETEGAEIRANRADLKDQVQVLKAIQKNPEEYYPRLQAEFPNLYKKLYERAWELRIIPRALPKTLIVSEGITEYGLPEYQLLGSLSTKVIDRAEVILKEAGIATIRTETPTEATAGGMYYAIGLKDIADFDKATTALLDAGILKAKPIRPAWAIPKAEAGMPEAGLQVDMFGYTTPVQPKGRGKIVQISLDDYEKLIETYEEQGLPMPYTQIKPKIEGISELSGDSEFQQAIFSAPDIATEEQRRVEFDKLVGEAKALMMAAKAPYWQARAASARAMEIVRQPGLGEGYLPMPFAGGRIFNQDFIDACNQFFGLDKGRKELNWISDSASILRMAKASLDFSAMAIQGLPSFGLAHAYLLRNPRIGLKLMGGWYKALAYSTAAFFHPSVFYSYMERNQNAVLQRVNGFAGTSRAIDYFDVLRAKHGIGKLAAWIFEKMPLKPYARAELAFYSAGEIVRTEMWKALSPKAIKQGKGFELARHLDLLTGISDAQAAGVPLTVRQLESAFTWFAPNYTRACLSLLADIFRGGYTGAQARKALGGLLGAGVAYYIGIQFAMALLSGKDEDDAWRSVLEGLGVDEDPITGEITWRPTGRLMTIKVGNYYFGIGGFWYGLVRLAGNIGDCINEVGGKERIDLIQILEHNLPNRDNPFVYWWYSRSSPLVGTGIELATNSDFLGYPIETPAEYAKYLISRFEPIWMEQGLNWLVPGAVRDYEIPEGAARAAVPIFEIFGWRTFPESSWVKFYNKVQEYIKQIPRDELDGKQIEAWEKGTLGWGELTKKQQQDLLQRYPELAELYDAAQSDSKMRDSGIWKAYTERLDEERAIYYGRIDEYTQRLLNGEIDTKTYRELCSEAGQNYGAIMEAMERDPTYAEIYEYFAEKEAEGSKYEFRWDLAYAEYNSMIRFADDPTMYLTNGDYNWDERDRRIAEFVGKWGVDLYNEILNYINTQKEEKGLNPIWVRKGQDSEKLSREYWNLPYQPISQMTEEDYNEGNIPAEYYASWKQYQNLSDAEKEGFLALHPELTKDWRAEYRKAHPEADAMLALWGYGGKIQSMEAYNLLKHWGQELGIPLSQMGLGLPSENLMPAYFDYSGLLTNYSPNSAEAKLWKLEHPEFTNWAMEQWGWEGTEDYKGIEYYQFQVKWRDKENEYNAIEGDIARQDFLKANPQYWTARLTMRAMDDEFPEDLIPDYVGWYQSEFKDYGDDWWLMEHKEFYDTMYELGIWTEPRDFSKVPTKEVWNLYQTYLGLPTGKPRYDFRAEHPELDDWLVLKFGYKPVGSKGEAGAEKTPWEEAAEVKQFQELFKGIFPKPQSEQDVTTAGELQKVKDFLAQSEVNENPYVSGQYACMDFTADLLNEAQKAGLSIGLADLTFWEKGGHRIAWISIGGQIYYIEPQSDVLYTLDELRNYWAGVGGTGGIAYIVRRARPNAPTEIQRFPK